MADSSTSWLGLVAAGTGFIAGGLVLLASKPQFLRHGVIGFGILLLLGGVYIALTERER